MRKWSAIVLVSLLLVIGLPQITEASQGKDFDKNLQTYLQEISKVRGFEVTISDIEFSLGFYEMNLGDFADVAELKEFLGEVIQKDGSNLEAIYEDYSISAAELEALLKEYGESLDDYVFVDDIWISAGFYLEEKIIRDPNFDDNLEIWLVEVSKVRGFEITRKHIEDSLALYESTLDEFKTVERVSDFLGEVIEKDLGNLDWVYEIYGISEQELLQTLKDNQLDINDYVFTDDLMYDLDGIIGWEDDNLEEELAQVMKEFGLTEEELIRLEEHFISIADSLFEDENMARLMNLADRLIAFEEFDTATDLSIDQIGELISIYKEFISLFQLKVEFILVQSGSETQMSIQDLFGMEKLVNANLLIKINNVQDEFLADLLITGEMVDSDSLQKVGKDIKNVLDNQAADKNHAPIKGSKDYAVESGKETVVKSEKAPSTEKGAKLPSTASNFVDKSIGWLLVSLVGMTFLLRIRKTGSEK